MCQRDEVWLVQGRADRNWYTWGEKFYTNISAPDSDQLNEGHVVNVPADDIVLVTPEYVSAFLRV